MSRHLSEIRLRPVTEADLDMFRRFVVEPLADLAPELVPPSVRIASGGEVRRLGKLLGY